MKKESFPTEKAIFDTETEEGVDKYLAFCEEGGATPRFKGYAPFEILLRQGRIAPFFTSIRIMYTGSIDETFYVNDGGLLEQAGIDNPIPLDPKDVLSKEKHPEGWEPEKLRPKQ